MRKFLVLGALLIAIAGLAGANTIYSNGAPDLQTSWLSDLDPNNPFGAAVERAGDFVLSQGASTVTDVHWWGVYFPSNTATTDNFTIAFYADNGGVPGALIASYAAGAVVRTGTGLTEIDGDIIYAYDYVLPSALVLTPSATYYVAIANNTPGTSDGWYWDTSAQTGTSFRHQIGTAWTAQSGYELAFELTGPNDGVVPEPATMTLMGIGLAMGAASRLRRKAR